MKFQDLQKEFEHHSAAAEKLERAAVRRYEYGTFTIVARTYFFSGSPLVLSVEHPDYGYMQDPMNSVLVPTQVVAIMLAIRRWHEDWVGGQKPELPVALGPIIEAMGAGCPRCGK